MNRESDREARMDRDDGRDAGMNRGADPVAGVGRDDGRDAGMNPEVDTVAGASRDVGLDIIDDVGVEDGAYARRRRRLGWFLVAALLIALLLAGVVSNFASQSPDALEHAARAGCTLDAAGEITGGRCMARGETGHQLAGSPFADYRLGGLSGVVGVLVTFTAGSALIRLALVAKK